VRAAEGGFIAAGEPIAAAIHWGVDLPPTVPRSSETGGMGSDNTHNFDEPSAFWAQFGA
jgi:hypothetical protein